MTGAAHSTGERVAIDAGLVATLISSQFPRWAGLPISKVDPGGWSNATFRLGDHMSVRLPRAAHYVEQVAKEQRWLPVLAPRLPLPIPALLAMGAPGEGYAWPWSVCGWIEGDSAAAAAIPDMTCFAADLAAFLSALRRIDATGGPSPGPHNFHRGGALAVYEDETRRAVAALGAQIDARAVAAVWAAALAAKWRGSPVWLHGDVTPGNVLIRTGRVSAVIDFGNMAVGDPACDLAIAWTHLSGESREAFRAGVQLDAGTCARARGWALWKALIVYAGLPGVNPLDAERSPRIIADVLQDHADHA